MYKKFDNLLPKNGHVCYIPKYFDLQDSERLYHSLKDSIAWSQHPIKIFGKLVMQPRLTAWYGDDNICYTYSNLSLTASPWTQELLEIKSSLENFCDKTFNSVLLNYYRDGNDYMGTHSDDEKELGPNPLIASVSLGTTRSFRMKHKKEKGLSLTLELEPGSLLIMSKETQHFWKHELPKRKRVTTPRINLTFRQIIGP